MNKIKFYEALYASCDNIVARRKSLVMPFVMILIGVALPLISMFALKGSQYDDINSSVVLVGLAIAIIGGIWLLGRVTSKGEPYHKAKGAFLSSKILAFDRSRRSEVISAIGSKDYKALLAIPVCEVSALSVMVVSLPDNSFAAVQAFEYAELEYRELCPVTVLSNN